VLGLVDLEVEGEREFEMAVFSPSAEGELSMAVFSRCTRESEFLIAVFSPFMRGELVIALFSLS